MFRSSTIVRELALKLATVTLMLKHSVKLRRYLLCGCVAACHGMACVLYAMQNAQYLTELNLAFHEYLEHLSAINMKTSQLQGHL
jgi:uncharacterized membrane protein YjjB (DUF3815 family)